VRLVYVEASAADQVGRRLVAHDRSRRRLQPHDAGTTMCLPARRLYTSLGFELTASEPHHSYGVDLVGETWERGL
jgi:hypothetical protein